MLFEKKYLTRSALSLAALMFAGCAAGTPVATADVPAKAGDGVHAGEEVELQQVSETSATDTLVVVDEEIEVVPANAPKMLSKEEIEKELKKLSEETNKIHLEKSLIESRLALASSENERAMQAMKLEKMVLDAERAERSAKIAEEIAGLEDERTEIERRIALENSRSAATFRAKQKELSLLEMALREQQLEMNGENMRTQYVMSMAEKQEKLSRLAPKAAVSPKYLKEPFVDGTLYISDRRVPLNGPITEDSAKTVCEQLYFFNNQNSEYPIFIVIDSSPGGSVAAGYQIQKAMQSCTAPVYVVVKSFAASMAAVITTTAERSFCYANSRILHHQISTGVQGNLTMLREGVAMGELWYKRFGEPVAKKMGLTLEEFTRQMYAHNSDGDWQENGERAVELKWVDHIAERIEETGVISLENPPKEPNNGMMMPTPPMPEQTDAQGRRFVELPVLENPFDFWAIYDKTGYYRAR
ncbi:MAG: ATP-dependent Clp protease proteolytic subunit [Opitutales bacterium]|nr:ATP-dependent Clp protease proteolytic subunit [Opitutales bacterium]